MKEKIVIDIGKIMDEMFEAAQNFTDEFQKNFKHGPGREHHCKGEPCGDNYDYYPAYSYPPTNVYLTKDKNLIFEFALAGFDEKTIDLQFSGDYMVLSANVPEENKPQQDEIRYFKRRLKFKEIKEQKYYVPDDKFDRENVKAVYKNGMLRVIIPPREAVKPKEGVKIDIEVE